MKRFRLRAVCIWGLLVITILAGQSSPVSNAGMQTESTFDQVKNGIETITKGIWPLAIAMAAVGTLAMALIQAAKDIFGVRRWFQARYLSRWLEAKAKSFQARAQTFAPLQTYAEKAGQTRASAELLDAGDIFAVDGKQAEADLIRLATSADRRAFYELPIEQLAGQMNAAVQAALDYPLAHRDLLWCLAHLAAPDDIVAVLAPPREFLDQEREKLSESEKRIVDNFVAARNRVTHQVQRAIDGLQIAAGAAWKRQMQLWSMGVSAALGAAALFVATRRLEIGPSVWMLLMTGVLAGLLAPVARDLVAALQSLRK